MKSIFLSLLLILAAPAYSEDFCKRFYTEDLDPRDHREEFLRHCLGNHIYLEDLFLASRSDEAQIRSDASLELGLRFSVGMGLPFSPKFSALWYGISAELGDPVAQYRMFLLHRASFGLEPNSEEALQWLRLSVRQSHADALFALAGCYEYGEGVQLSLPMARYYYARAIAQGHLGAASAYAYLDGR